MWCALGSGRALRISTVRTARSPNSILNRLRADWKSGDASGSFERADEKKVREEI